MEVYMQKKILKPIFSFVLAFVMAVSIFVGFIPATASAKVTQSEIDDLKSQKAALSEQSASYEKTISSLKNKKNAQVELKTALDSKLALTNQQIMNLEEQIKLHDALIERKTQEVDEAQKTADEQLEKYKKRVRAMEESGRYNYFEVLFGANSIGEFLSLIDDIGDIMQSDKELEESYKQSVTDLKTVKAEYEEAQAGLSRTRPSVQSSRISFRSTSLRLRQSSLPCSPTSTRTHPYSALLTVRSQHSSRRFRPR